MTALTIVIPCAPHHEHLIACARASCEAQTLPVSVVVYTDHDRKGAGFARNRGLEHVNTPFVTFLDADDTLEPTFAERTLSAFEASGRRRYIYTDWYQNEKLFEAPACAWVNHTWHVVTTLLPTEWVRSVGGFDETLPGGEDTEFYIRLCAARRCGLRLAVPLMRYQAGGERSKAFVQSSAYEQVMQEISRRHGGKQMSCCGVNSDEIVTGEKQAGDVLARAMWAGNRQQRGRMTGRLYPRAGNGAQLWVDPRDIDKSPELFQAVALGGEPAVDFITQLFGAFGNAQDTIAKQRKLPTMHTPVGGEPAPDFARALALYAEGQK